MKIKICYIISLMSENPLMVTTGQFLDKSRYEVSFIFLNPELPRMYEIFKGRGHQVEWIKYHSKKELIQAVVRVRRIFSKFKPDIVHTHFIDASLVGLIAARLSGIERRVHTRHNSMENHDYFPHGVYYDKLVNRLSKKIIAITEMVAEVLIKKENVVAEKVEVIHHGFDFEQLKNDEKTTYELAQKYGLTESYPVVGVNSRFIQLKGIQYIVPAFAKLAQSYPKAKLVLANAFGYYSRELKSLLEKHLLPSQYVLIAFESHIFDLYKNFDVFVHVPIDRESEAFGLIYVEALALEVPSVFTISGIAIDFIEHRKNALVVPYKDSDAIYEAVNLILKDENLRVKIVLQGKSDVRQLFDIRKTTVMLDALYAVL